jgi:hypothetical protein
MSFKITAESDLWESRGTFTLASVQLLNLRSQSSTLEVRASDRRFRGFINDFIE